jgi:hypothetical protein
MSRRRPFLAKFPDRNVTSAMPRIADARAIQSALPLHRDNALVPIDLKHHQAHAHGANQLLSRAQIGDLFAFNGLSDPPAQQQSP